MRNSTVEEKRRKWAARRKRTNKALARAERPVVKVYRSSKHIYAQILDPSSGETLGGVSTRSPSVVSEGNTGNIDAAKKVGAALAALAKEKRLPLSRSSQGIGRGGQGSGASVLIWRS